ncbi:UNVERIFIED_CONTAM: Retrovirus-related Pol polyprotein from transposon RE1 [Sesamum indicum]
MTSSSSEMPEAPFTMTGAGSEYTTIRMLSLESQGMVMVSAPFNGNNWLSWSRSVRIALESKDKLSFIDGSGIRPAIGTPQYKQWRITDCMVRTWILNTISKDLVNAYLYANSSRDLWMELEARYGECDGTLLYKLQREISSISQGNMSVTGQILVLEPLPLVNKAYSMVLRVERQRMVNSEYSDVGDASAMKAYEYKHNIAPKNITRGKGPMDKRHLFCEHCNRSRHNKESCFKLHGFPDWYKELRDQRKKQNNNGRAYAAADAAQSSIEPSNSNGVQLMFELLDALRMVQRNIPQDPVNVHFAQVEEMAGMSVEYSNSAGCISSSWIVDTGATSHMCGDDLKADRILAIGKQHNDKNDFSLWHQRLGHSSPDVMKHIVALHIPKPHKEHICNICPLAKQTRVPFPLSTSNSISCFDLIHVDIWGPYKRATLSRATLSGAHYVLTIIDDFSRATWTFLMRHKSQTLITLTTFFAQILTQFSCKIKVVRTDNGSEFLSSQCQFFFQNQGVIHQKSCTYMPQQNGVVERKHRHLLEVARALMFQSHLPNIFWGDSILTATHIIKLPSSILSWKSPFEILHNSPLAIRTLRLSSSCNDDAPPIDTFSPSELTPPPHSADSSPPPCLRRSQRISHPPAWLHDFVCHSSHHSPFVFTSSHSVFQAALSTIREPQSYNQAKESVEWKQAMQNELCALEQNQTWDVVDLSPNKRPIGCKWVYKIKLNPDGSVERYKARLVAKGYNQIEGIDYFDRFSPVAKVVTVRVFLTVATGSCWPIHQVDINNAFLHGFLDEDIYMEAPAGYNVPSGKCCKLQRSLYGLKQASRQWNQELTTKLIHFGFTQSLNDYCLFVKGSSASLIILLVYVDDLLITGPSELLINEVKSFLDAAFSIKDLAYAKYFLGLEIARSYVGFDQCKPASTPLPLGLTLSSQSSPSLDDPEPFRRLVGRLLYLGFTRPDISYAAQQLSQFVHAPCQVVRFIPASASSTLTAYCDADWANCVDTRRSLTGYCIFLGDALISCKTKKQSTVSRSTAEVEYRSLGATVCELQWLAYLLQDFHITVSTPISLFCDNQAALHIVANPVFHERTKTLGD